MPDNNTPTTASLIEQGYLVPPRLYVRPAVLEHELHARSIVAAYQSTCAGKRVVVFVNTVAYAEYLAEQFVAARISALTILASHNDAKRRAALADFTDGNCMVLININMADLAPGIADGVIITTPHNAARRYEQQIITAMRPRYAQHYPKDTDAQRRAAIAASDKPAAMILDMADNWQRHPDVIASVTYRAKPDSHLTIPGSLEWDQWLQAEATLDRSPGGAGEIARLRAELQEWKYRAENPAFNGRLDTWQAACGKARGETEKLRAKLTEVRALLATTNYSASRDCHNAKVVGATCDLIDKATSQ